MMRRVLMMRVIVGVMCIMIMLMIVAMYDMGIVEQQQADDDENYRGCTFNPDAK